MTRSHPEFNDDHAPIAYLITFRGYGTWLHGDSRGAVDRFHRVYGTPMLPPNRQRTEYEQGLLTRSSVKLDARQRAAVERGIRETCTIRKWLLWAFNIRTNHVHAVVSANCKPEPILSALKANATRSMREAGCWQNERALGLPWQQEVSLDRKAIERRNSVRAVRSGRASARTRLVTEPEAVATGCETQLLRNLYLVLSHGRG
jgi:REP element-mobilizing transposase RayT